MPLLYTNPCRYTCIHNEQVYSGIHWQFMFSETHSQFLKTLTITYSKDKYTSQYGIFKTNVNTNKSVSPKYVLCACFKFYSYMYWITNAKEVHNTLHVSLTVSKMMCSKYVLLCIFKSVRGYHKFMILHSPIISPWWDHYSHHQISI